MLTLYHSPNSRSTRIIGLIEAMNIRDKIDIRLVSIMRQDGSGGRDLNNLHPEGKVPCLVHDGVEIWESAAIILYLTDLFPEGGMGVPVGHPQRGRYVSWLSYYAGIVEPV
ncbi:MAG: glutathione S-transferase N-terminal domain-containing protein, partial [Asticcacaulis sp.]